MSSSIAMRVTTSTRSSSGSSVISSAALPGFRCARISAIVCGCSPRMNFESCSGSAFSSDAKPAVEFIDRRMRSMTRCADCSPSVRTSSRRALLRSPLVTNSAATSVWWNSSSTFSLVSCGTEPSDRHLAREPLDLFFRQVAEDLGRRVFAEQQRHDRCLANAGKDGLDSRHVSVPYRRSTAAAASPRFPAR